MQVLMVADSWHKHKNILGGLHLLKHWLDASTLKNTDLQNDSIWQRSLAKDT